MSVAVTGTTTDGGALAASLTAALTPVADVASCVTGAAATTALDGFTTTASPVSLAKRATTVLCLQLTLSYSAPSTVQGQSATFAMTMSGKQVAP